MASDVAGEVADGLGLTVADRLAGGEWGAFLVSNDADERFVLKIMPHHSMATVDRVRRAVELVESLRLRRYPAPKYFDVGERDGAVYSLQAFVAGSIPDVLVEPLAQRLVELIGLQGDVAEPNPAWCDQVVQALREGAEALWTDHDVLRNVADRRVTDLLGEIVGVGERVEPTIFRQSDVVHGDFHHRNLLAVNDEVTAVFDWESATVGDAHMDLAKLAFWCEAMAGTQVHPRAAEAVIRAADETISSGVRAAFAGVFALQQLTFAVRSRPELLEWTLMIVEQALAPRWRGSGD
jgi:aminoglycoside phosphotransferase (APT) family kinase protein